MRKINFGGLDWTIPDVKVNLNFLVSVEDLTGKPYMGGTSEVPTLAEMRAMFYLLLKRAATKEQPMTWTLEQVGDMIGPDNIADVIRVTMEAIDGAAAPNAAGPNG